MEIRRERMNGQNDETPTNPYMALRAAKIARNQARLRELGLHKPAQFSNGLASSRKRTTKQTNKNEASVVPERPRRRSSRISGFESNPDYKESNDFKELGRRGTKRSSDTADETPLESRNERIPPKPRNSSRPQNPTVIATNSVRTISLDASKLVEKFLAKPMETFGKYFVIETSFHEAAHPEDQERLSGVSRLSFNKFSGVQPWKNVIFLWINVGGPKGGLVNDFSRHKNNGSCNVSWFGGSRMTEDSPVIQDLIRMGKEPALAKREPTSSAILLWCRNYDWETKKLPPYTCLGRLAYESHEAGSYPVAFTWRLIDCERMFANESTRSVFQEISGLE